MTVEERKKERKKKEDVGIGGKMPKFALGKERKKERDFLIFIFLFLLSLELLLLYQVKKFGFFSSQSRKF